MKRKRSITPIFHYAIIPKSEMNSETQKHLRETGRTARIVPWNTDEYISFPATDASLNGLCDSCLETLIEQDTPIPSYCDRCFDIINKWKSEQKTKPKKQRKKTFPNDKVIEKNFAHIKNIAKFLSPFSELEIKRNTIKIYVTIILYIT